MTPDHDPGAQAPVSAWFLGPKSEHAATWGQLLDHVLQDYLHWRRNYFPQDPLVIGHALRRTDAQAAWLDGLNEHLDDLVSRLKADFPFFHPRYLAHMLSEQTLPSVVGYFAAMLYNANNVTDEAAPVTVDLEVEVGQMVAEMLGYAKGEAWAHVTSGGTVANIEALWTARQAQFAPLALRDLCAERGWRFEVTVPSGDRRPLAELTDLEALGLRPRDAVGIPGALTRELVAAGMDRDVVAAALRTATDETRWNPRRHGYARVLLEMRPPLLPRVLAPATAHYSVRKAADILGYGEDAVEIVPVDHQFRLDVDALRDMLVTPKPGTYVAAVVGVIGTTEEGAVDPLHRILDVRAELERGIGLSFWLHADAAWGGYVASLLRSEGAAPGSPAEAHELIGARDAVELTAGGDPLARKIHWADDDVVSAYLRLGDADSITVDPHKLGYVPYPAGIVAFRDGRVAQLMKQQAPYIDASSPAGGDEGERVKVGMFALEGSKPGASAAACWLAHKAIPLRRDGHGELMRQTVLAARRLHLYLELHDELYADLELASGRAGDADAFTLLPLSIPDTNVVCFVARPMTRMRDGQLHPSDVRLRQVNALNETIHARLAQPPGKIGSTTPHSHPFFVSRSTFAAGTYSAASMRPILERLHLDPDEYAADGLFYLRSAVMNPHYALARPKTDYLLEFVGEVHRTAAGVLDERRRG